MELVDIPPSILFLFSSCGFIILATMAGISSEKWHERLSAFLARTDTRPHQLDALDRLLTIVPERESPHLLLAFEDAEVRRFFMLKLEMYWKQKFSEFTGLPKEEYKPLPQIIIATIMTMDLATLRRRAHDTTLDDCLRALFVMPCFVKTSKYLLTY
jgi:hypothetical protein